MKLKKLPVMLWIIAAALVAALYLLTREPNYFQYASVSGKAMPPQERVVSVEPMVSVSVKDTPISQTKVQPTDSPSDASSSNLASTGSRKRITNSASGSQTEELGFPSNPTPTQEIISNASAPNKKRFLNGYLSAPLASQALREESLATSGMERDRFLEACKHDHDLYLAPGQQPLYICEMADTQIGPNTTPITTTPAFPISQTFVLHSRPTATRKIYLDFTGHTTTGTNWNSFWANPTFTTPPFSLDANTATFNSAEHAVIQDIWRSVTEHYAPFDVDVTTEDPGIDGLIRTSVADLRYGTRVVIGPDQNNLSAGLRGIAYVRVFGRVVTPGTPDLPCFDFVNYPVTRNSKSIAETASHEVGHTLGLNHDGRLIGTTTEEYFGGHGSGVYAWGPMMGNRTINPIVVQWSKGEYTYANNYQDDIALIATYLPFVPDDHGGTIVTATTAPNTQLKAGGIISSSTDIDMFKVSVGSGNLVITPKVALFSPTLRLQVKVLDASGTTLGTYEGTGAVGNMAPAPITLPVSAGVYYIQLDGIGNGDGLLSGYTDYASIGYYDLTATWSTTVNQPPLAVTTGTTPLTYNYQSQPNQAVSFNGLLSTDPDGIITRYSWNFNDIYPAAASTALATHRFKAPGVYRPVLTVTDDAGAKSSATVTIQVTGPTLPNRSSLLSFSASFIRIDTNNDAAKATLQVQDQYGNPVRNALVRIRSSGLSRTLETTQRTDVNGLITVTSTNIRRGAKGSVRFEVTAVNSSTHPYVAADNDCPTFVTVKR